MFDVWCKLKACKYPLKNIMKRDIGNVNMKIEKAREALLHIQQCIDEKNNESDLLQREKTCKIELEN